MKDEHLTEAEDHAHICSRLAEQYSADPVLFAALTDAAAIIRDLLRACLNAIGATPRTPPAGDGALTDGVALIAAERRRQIEVEGWTPKHDDEHASDELALAAVCYAMPESGRLARYTMPPWWPWDASWWKPSPTDRVRELVKAGALIAAEIERLQRADAIAARDAQENGHE
jgi:hypothetical protein